MKIRSAKPEVKSLFFFNLTGTLFARYLVHFYSAIDTIGYLSRVHSVASKECYSALRWIYRYYFFHTVISRNPGVDEIISYQEIIY